jgi:hypothetical protein
MAILSQSLGLARFGGEREMLGAMGGAEGFWRTFNQLAAIYLAGCDLEGNDMVLEAFY